MGAEVHPMMSSIYLVMWNMYLYSLTISTISASYFLYEITLNIAKMSVSAYSEGFGMPYKMTYWQEYYLMKHIAKNTGHLH